VSTGRWVFTELGHCWKVGLHGGWDSVRWQVDLYRAGALWEGMTSQGSDTVSTGRWVFTGLGHCWKVGLQSDLDIVNWLVGLHRSGTLLEGRTPQG
jgi:hypothetical protein